MYDYDLPPGFTSLRPAQQRGLDQALDAFEHGAQLVVLEAPTGGGKTVLAETLRRTLPARGIYLCTSLVLQDQFAHDFDYAAVLKGRSNYPTLLHPERFPEITAADCTKERMALPACDDCPDQSHSDEAPHCDMCCVRTFECPYELAKGRAADAELAVTNTAYFLAECNYLDIRSRFTGWPLVIIDEADRLEEELMRFVEVAISPRMQKSLGLAPPAKKTVEEAWAEWVPYAIETVGRAQKVLRGDTLPIKRRRKTLSRLKEDLRRIEASVADGTWIYCYEPGDTSWIRFRPVHVRELGQEYLWRHGERFLCMSATIISPDQFAFDLGFEGAWEPVHVPSSFPVENRPVRVVPVTPMSKRHQEEAWPKMARAIACVLGMHPEERVLVHTHSYSFTEYLQKELGGSVGREVYSYTSPMNRDEALEDYKATERAVLLAPSMERGVDLPGDLCRVTVLAKVPFPYLGDKQVAARLYSRGGRGWYDVQTVRAMVQMTGRGVRSEEDYATSYILDSDFVRLQRKAGRIIPKWWGEALQWSGPWMKKIQEAAG